jgi:hypothetical protein
VYRNICFMLPLPKEARSPSRRSIPKSHSNEAKGRLSALEGLGVQLKVKHKNVAGWDAAGLSISSWGLSDADNDRKLTAGTSDEGEGGESRHGLIGIFMPGRDKTEER